MTNAVKESLQENMESILEKLPKEFHEDFKASVATATPTPQLTDEEAKKEAVEVIKHNPSIAAIDDKECQAYIDNGEEFYAAIEPATDEELKKQMKEMLEEVSSNKES